MNIIDVVAIVITVFWVGFMIGLEVSDRFWEPLWKQASDGWNRNIVKRLKEKLERREPKP